MTNQNELYHYGVLGMKWGIRRYQPYSVRPRGSGKSGREIGEARKSKGQIKREKTDRRSGVIADYKNRKVLSDEELKTKIKRLEDEAKFKKLVNENYRPVKSFFAEAASDALKSATKKTMGAAVDSLIRLGLGDKPTKKEFASYYKPKKK